MNDMNEYVANLVDFPIVIKKKREETTARQTDRVLMVLRDAAVSRFPSTSV